MFEAGTKPQRQCIYCCGFSFKLALPIFEIMTDVGFLCFAHDERVHDRILVE